MSTITLIIYLLAVVSVLLGIGGIGLLIFGLVNKKNKMTISGGIMTFIAIVLFITAVFWGAKRFFHFINQNVIKNECSHSRFMHDGQCMMGDTLMYMNDSTRNDSCVMVEKKMVMGNCCKKGDMKNCDPAKCKKSCPHHQ